MRSGLRLRRGARGSSAASLFCAELKICSGNPGRDLLRAHSLLGPRVGTTFGPARPPRRTGSLSQVVVLFSGLEDLFWKSWIASPTGAHTSGVSLRDLSQAARPARTTRRLGRVVFLECRIEDLLWDSRIESPNGHNRRLGNLPVGKLLGCKRLPPLDRRNMLP